MLKSKPVRAQLVHAGKGVAYPATSPEDCLDAILPVTPGGAAELDRAAHGIERAREAYERRVEGFAAAVARFGVECDAFARIAETACSGGGTVARH